MFQLSFRTDNAAFENGASEIGRILRDTAKCIEHGEQFEGTIRDINGNVIGRFKTTGKVTQS